MTSFVHTNYPNQHPALSRAESVIEGAQTLRREFDGGKSLAAMLLAAVVAALVCVADQMIDTWADGNLLAAWVVLWAVAFAAMALFADSVRGFAARVVAALDAWSHRMALARADERLWDMAQRDPRVMAELQAAISRSEVEAPAPARKAMAVTAKLDAAFERRAKVVPYL